MKRKDRKPFLTHQNGFQMAEGPAIPGHHVQHSDAHHLLLMDGVVLSCTPTEYTLLMHLLQQHPHYVSFETLEKAIWAHSHTKHLHRALTRHISHLRTKLWPLSLDILCLIDYGYLLHTEQHGHVAALPEEEHAPA